MTDDARSNPPPDDVSAADVYERITDAVFALDEEWRFTYLDEQAERLLQRSEDELLGSVIWDEFTEAPDSKFRQEYERAMASQTPVTFEAQYPPLDTWFEVRAYPSETGLSVYFRDVTERVRRENVLQEREQALRRAYEVIADSDRTFSEQIEALLNVVKDAVGTDYATLSRVHGDRYVFEVVATPDDADLEAGDTVPLKSTNCDRVVATEQTLVLNDVERDAPEMADRSGNAEWGISCYLGAPVSVGGDVYGSFCFYDMESRSRAFSDWQVTFVNLLSNWVSYELERQRQNERLESFAGMVAHELRNPLHIAQLYHERASDGDEAAAEEVATALERIEEIIDVVLVTARSEDSVIDWEAVELADAATEAWANVTAGESKLAVETDLTVESDPIHLQHLLQNLFKNAVEHGSTSPRSQVHEDAVEHTDSGVTVTVGRLPSGFYVADDGPGIPPEERATVFDAGYTTDEGGIGLGLTFVKQLADTYDWECRVTESDAGGTRFEFTGVDIIGE
ncbi:ATP-binding protein [Halorussus sp. MSC15.2]|uniref:sensor histidine kinase n=1 Tax=Halorussus sp. MSC15.2 TaxID=2283638 RepID=UPI0013D0C07E|nr:ATP-binding protein [Halorussus sp. MSC15.2]NEU56325.1 GAF domain-containing protein [Halorussus sp. MSC15.2]